MHNIKLQNVIPAIFSHHREDIDSDVWKQNVIFERGRVYLIEADSGKGKSTLCSYMIGYRDDYNGYIAFDNTDIRRLNVQDWVKIRKEHISLLFQELRLFPELTAYENVEIKTVLQSLRHKKKSNIGLTCLESQISWRRKLAACHSGNNSVLP